MRRDALVLLVTALGLGCDGTSASSAMPSDGLSPDAGGDAGRDTAEDLTADADQDGFTAEEGDCDDTDDAVHPGAAEVLDDGIDQDCSGHDALTCVGDYLYADAQYCGIITGDLLIGTDLVTIDGLDSLTHIGGNLHVIGSAASSLAINTLTHVGGSIEIHSNDSLVSLSLSGLTDVGVELRVGFNDSLTSFALDGIEHIGADLFFWYNGSLCQSRVDAFIELLRARDWEGSALYADHNADC